MHDPQSDTTGPEVRLIPLSRKDVDDASRLLKLLASEKRPEPVDAAQAETRISTDELLGRARQIVAQRRRRLELFGAAIFGEPAWEMLLLLYVTHTSRRFTVGQLADQSGASKSTGARWIDYLEQRQFVEKDHHPTDRRLSFVRLSSKGRSALEMYLSGTVATSE